MSETAEIKGVIPSYYGFLITGLTQIREYWAKQQYIEALNYTLNLTALLPRKIKKELQPEKDRIRRELARAFNVSTTSFYTVQNARVKAAVFVAMRELEPYLDKLTSLLDANNLLTQQYGVPTRSRSMKDFQMTVDRAQYEAEKGETT